MTQSQQTMEKLMSSLAQCSCLVAVKQINDHHQGSSGSHEASTIRILVGSWEDPTLAHQWLALWRMDRCSLQLYNNWRIIRAVEICMDDKCTFSMASEFYLQ